MSEIDTKVTFNHSDYNETGYHEEEIDRFNGLINRLAKRTEEWEVDHDCDETCEHGPDLRDELEAFVADTNQPFQFSDQQKHELAQVKHCVGNGRNSLFRFSNLLNNLVRQGSLGTLGIVDIKHILAALDD